MQTNFKKIIDVVDLKGGTWTGLFSLVMLIGLIKTVILGGPDIPTGVLGLYGTVVGVYGLSRFGAKAINGKNGHTVTEE